MSGLTEERKQQIRAEEHARIAREEEARREQEEQYRADVRREEEYRAEVRREEEYRAEVRRDIERDRVSEVATAPSSYALEPGSSSPTPRPYPPTPAYAPTWTAPPATPEYAPTWTPLPPTQDLAPAWTPPPTTPEYAPTWTPPEYPPTQPVPTRPRDSEGAPRPPPTRAGRLYKLGGLLLLLGLVVTVISLWVSPSRGSSGDAELVATGDGELAPSEAEWDPADLAVDDIYIRDGEATAVPDKGITTLAELGERSHASPSTTASTPAPPLGPHTPSAPDAARATDALVELVPADATTVIALDLPQIQRSPGLTSVVTRILTQTPLGETFTKTLQAGGGDLAKGSAVLAGLPKAGSEPATLMAFRGPFDAAAVTSHLTSQGAVSSTVGTDTLLTFPHTVVVMREDMIVFGAPAVIERARAAAGGVKTSPLGEPIAQMRTSPAGFALVRPNAALRKQLSGIMPGLASATWIALGIDTSSGVVFTVRAALASADTATRAAAQLQASRASLRVPKASFTSNGPILEMVVPVEEAALQALVVTRADA